MKKFTLTSVLAVLFGMGAMAQNNIKQSVVSEDYETGEHGWSGSAVAHSIETDEATGNKYYQVLNKESNKVRAGFKSYAADLLEGVENWGVEFDMLMAYDQAKANCGLALMGSEGATKYNNWPSNTTGYLVMRQQVANDSVFNVMYSYDNGKYDTLGTVVLDPTVFYHYDLNVKGEVAHITITDHATSTELFNHTYDIQLDSVGVFRHIQINAGCKSRPVQLDNLNIYKEVSLDFVEVPTAEITRVKGIERQITLDCVTAGSTLEYIISHRIYDEVLDSAWYADFSDWTAYVIDEPITISNNVKIVVRATKGSVSAESDTLKFNAGTELKLNGVQVTDPVFNAEMQTYTAKFSTNTSNILCNPTAYLICIIDGKKNTVQNNTTFDIPVGAEFTTYAMFPGYINSDTLVGVATAPYSRMAADRIEIASYSKIEGLSGNTGFGETLFTQQINDTLYYDVQEIVIGMDTLTGENILFPDNRIGLVDIAYKQGNSYHGWTFNSSVLRCLYENGYVGVRGLKQGQMIEVDGTNLAPVAMNDVATLDAFHAANGKYELRVQKDGDFLFETGKTANTGPRLNHITIYDTRMATSADLKGWSLYYNPTDSVELPIEVMAYSVEEDTVNNGVLNLSLVQDGIIPVATPVLIKAKSGVAFSPVQATASATTNFATHKTQLYGVSERTKLSDSKARYEYYTLGLDEEGNICMKHDSIGASPIVKAFSGYFRATKADHLAKDSTWTAPAKYTFSFLPGQEPIYYPEDNVVVGPGNKIEELNRYETEEMDNIFYDLMGRRVTILKRGGIYIVKGKKMFVK